MSTMPAVLLYNHLRIMVPKGIEPFSDSYKESALPLSYGTIWTL